MAKPFVSDKLAKRRRAEAKARRAINLIMLTLVLGAAAFLVYASKFQIKGVVISGVRALDASQLEATALSGVRGNAYYFIPKSNIFLYPREALRESLAQTYPRLENIDLGIEKGGLLVRVTEREPAYLWCGEQIPLSRAEAFSAQCYFVDRTGLIFADAPQFSDAVYQRIYTTLAHHDDSSEWSPIGKQAMGKDVLRKVSVFAKEISSETFKPSAYSITPDGDALILLSRESDILPEIRYNPAHDPVAIGAGLKTAILAEPLKTKLGRDFKNLEYIDARFLNKVFYKFHEEGNQKNNKSDDSADITGR